MAQAYGSAYLSTPNASSELPMYRSVSASTGSASGSVEAYQRMAEEVAASAAQVPPARRTLPSPIPPYPCSYAACPPRSGPARAGSALSAPGGPAGACRGRAAAGCAAPKRTCRPGPGPAPVNMCDRPHDGTGARWGLAVAVRRTVCLHAYRAYLSVQPAAARQRRRARGRQGQYWMAGEGARADAAAGAGFTAVDVNKGVETLRAAIHGGAGPPREQLVGILSQLLREASGAQARARAPAPPTRPLAPCFADALLAPPRHAAASVSVRWALKLFAQRLQADEPCVALCMALQGLS